MLKSLHIRNLATIEHIDMVLKPGFSVLTGETGAGKSIIIDGIRLILGEKGSKDLIRTGEKQTSVEAVFLARKKNEQQPGKDIEVFLQRILSEQGSGRGYYNGTLVPAKILKEKGQDWVDIYGQNDHVFLRKTENQMDYLDFYSSAVSAREKVALSARKLRRLLREKLDLETKEKERNQRLDFLQFQIHEIEEADLKSGEEQALLRQRNILKNAEKINSLVAEALVLSYDHEQAILPQFFRFQDIVRTLGEFHPEFKETEKSLDQFSITVRELSDSLITFREKWDTSPEKLEAVEERLSLIEKLKRKYGVNTQEILSHLEKCRSEQALLSHSQEKLEELTKNIKKTFEEYRRKTSELRSLRLKSARMLEQDIAADIAFLGLNKARVNIALQPLEVLESHPASIRDTGTEEVEFLISPNPGEDMKPLRKIASGGELSRIMLALKSIGKEKGPSKTLIFDEIDAGIGGKIAEFVALRLKKLAQKNQVICITHLPQIASSASHHYRIEKKVKNERTYTTVKKLNFNERVEEIARLISGRLISATALQTAREMLEQNVDMR